MSDILLPKIKRENEVLKQSNRYLLGKVAETIILKGLIASAVHSMDWMITDMKNRFDEQRSCFGQEVSGGYSEDLTIAIELLEELRKIE